MLFVHSKIAVQQHYSALPTSFNLPLQTDINIIHFYSKFSDVPQHFKTAYWVSALLQKSGYSGGIIQIQNLNLLRSKGYTTKALKKQSTFRSESVGIFCCCLPVLGTLKALKTIKTIHTGQIRYVECIGTCKEKKKKLHRLLASFSGTVLAQPSSMNKQFINGNYSTIVQIISSVISDKVLTITQ